MAKIVVGDESYEYDTPDSFTFGELFDVEQKIGSDAGSIARAMGSLWICIRRKHPAFEFDQLRDVVFDATLLEALNAEDEDDVSPPAGGPQVGAKPDETLTGNGGGRTTGAGVRPDLASLATSGGQR